MEFLNKYRHLSWVLLLIPIYLLIFVRLGAFHIRLWDEGWFVVHVYEMLERGSMLVPYYAGEAVHYGSKPPIQTWLQMIFVKTMGYNELAVRLPSAIAAGATVLLIFHWVKKVSNETTAWLAALVLLTMDGFVHFHTARGAEADALLTLIIMAQVYFFWTYLRSNNIKHLWGLAAMIALSFWVKAVAGFLMLPGMALYVLIYERSRLLELLRQPRTYIILLTGIGLGLSYLLVREWAQPGHIAFMLEKQAGRLVNDVGHDQPFDYYYNRFKNERLAPILPLVIIGQLLPFFRQREEARPFQYTAVLALCYFLVISIARSKLEWYAMPLYPLYAILVAYPFAILVADMQRWKQLALIALIMASPLHTMFKKSQANRIDQWSWVYEMEEQYLFEAYNKGWDVENLNVIHDHFDGALMFYKYKFQDAGVHINLQNNVDLEIGERALVDSDALKEQLLSRYEVDTVDQMHHAIVYEIKAIKEANPQAQNDTDMLP